MLNWILTRLNRQPADDLERARALVHAADRGERPIDPDNARELARASDDALELLSSWCDAGWAHVWAG